MANEAFICCFLAPSTRSNLPDLSRIANERLDPRYMDVTSVKVTTKGTEDCAIDRRSDMRVDVQSRNCLCNNSMVNSL